MQVVVAMAMATLTWMMMLAHPAARGSEAAVGMAAMGLTGTGVPSLYRCHAALPMRRHAALPHAVQLRGPPMARNGAGAGQTAL